MEIKGLITGIIWPKKEKLAFVDGKEFFMFFLCYQQDGQSIRRLCKGNCFKVFVGETVKLTGTLVVGSNSYFKFDTLTVDFSASMNGAGLYKEIIGVKNFNKLAKSYGIAKATRSNLIPVTRDLNSALRHGTIGYFIKHGFEECEAREFIDNFTGMKTTCESMEILRGYGFNDYMIEKLRKVKPNFTMSEIQKDVENNPYVFMDTFGFTFTNCDYIYKSNGRALDDIRIAAAIHESLRTAYDVDGNCFLNRVLVVKKTLEVLNVDYFKATVDAGIIDAAIGKLLSTKELAAEGDDIYLRRNYEETCDLRDFARRANSYKEGNIDPSAFIKKYEDEHHMTLGREQKLAICNSLNHRISIITGGAGVGKTSSVACLMLYLIEELGIPEDRIMLFAPTGKAAEKLHSSIYQQTGKKVVSNTIHRGLGVVPMNGSMDDKFRYNRDNKLPADFVLVDESSMINYRVAHALIEAIPEESRIIFLGDIEQLEPVGAGFFFYDLIESGCPITYLKEVHRQKGDSTIIPLSQAVRDEVLLPSNIDKKADFFFLSAKTTSLEEKLKALYHVFERSLDKYGLDETMIITPLRETPENNKMDSRTINNYIQERLLPDQKGELILERNGYKFKLGSKVIMTKNDNTRGLINGQIGYIEDIDVEDGTIRVVFEDGEFNLKSADLNNLRLGYCITVHKSQGSDWKSVIYCCFDDTQMNKKNLVYTAVTRAKKTLVVMGDKKTFLQSDKLKTKKKNSKLLNETL